MSLPSGLLHLIIVRFVILPCLLHSSAENHPHRLTSTTLLICNRFCSRALMCSTNIVCWHWRSMVPVTRLSLPNVQCADWKITRNGLCLWAQIGTATNVLLCKNRMNNFRSIQRHWRGWIQRKHYAHHLLCHPSSNPLLQKRDFKLKV